MLNQFQLEGFLASEPKERMTELGASAFTVLLAVPRDPVPGSKQKVSDFIRLTAHGRTGEVIKKYVSVGQHMVVRGHLISYKVRQNGKEHLFTDNIVDRSYFVQNDATLTAEELAAQTQEEREATP